MDNYIFPYGLVDRDANIILYGAGTVGRCFYKQIITTGYPQLLLWVDREAERYRELGYPVETIDNIIKYANSAVIVIAIDNYCIAQDIKEELLEKFGDLSSDRIIVSDKYWFPSGTSVKCSEDEIRSAQRNRTNGSTGEISDFSGEERYNQESLARRRIKDGKLITKLCQVELPVRDIIMAQYKDHDYSDYQHCDMSVRYLAAMDILKHGKISGDLYYRMQKKSGFDWTERYTILVEKIKREGFDADTVVELDKNLIIMDGSHRITMAYILGKEFIKADIYDCIRDRGFDISFFWKEGFTPKECNDVLVTAGKILKDCNYEFEGVIWPPAFKIADDIIDAISEWKKEDIHVLSYEDITLQKDDFFYLFRAIYHPDILDVAGADLKFKQIEQSMGEEKQYTIRRFRLSCSSPMISVNEKNYLPQSLAMKRLKTTMRARFEERIKNYQYDIILHISDNYLQSVFIKELFDLDRNVSDLIPILDEFPYTIIRAFGRQHEKFPYSFYYFGDVDVLVEETHSDDLYEEVKEYMESKFCSGWQNIWIERTQSSVIIWVRIRDLPIFGVHIQTVKYFDMQQETDGWLFEKRIKHPNGFYVFPPEIDLYFRAVQLIRKPYKEHHRQYMTSNYRLYRQEIATRLFGENSDMLLAIEELMSRFRT